MKLEKFYWPATLAWAAIIYYQSIVPVTVAQKFGIQHNFFPFVEHFAAYAILCLLFYLSLNYSKIKYSALHAFVLAVSYGVAMELIQGFFAYREPSITDALVNAVGALVPTAFFEARKKKWI